VHLRHIAISVCRRGASLGSAIQAIAYGMEPSTAERGGKRKSQYVAMHFARQGVITEEMEYISKREKLEPE